MTGALLVAPWAVPLAMLAACLSPRVRAHMLDWLWLAAAPGLAAAIFARDAAPLVADEAGLRITLALDPAAAMVLVVEGDTLVERTLRTGVANWEFTEVVSGLAAGERIVTSLEREGVMAGAKVVLRPEEAR